MEKKEPVFRLHKIVIDPAVLRQFELSWVLHCLEQHALGEFHLNTWMADENIVDNWKALEKGGSFLTKCRQGEKELLIWTKLAISSDGKPYPESETRINPDPWRLHYSCP